MNVTFLGQSPIDIFNRKLFTWQIYDFKLGQ